MDVRTLCPAVYPDGSIILEWMEDTAATDAARISLENKIFSLFTNEKQERLYWLLVLGTSGNQVTLAPALHFFRSLASLFVRELRMQSPKRARGKPAFPEEEISLLLFSIPPFPGKERAVLAFFAELWDKLWLVFCSSYKPNFSTVDEYLTSISPTSSRADRVHFHLVENRLDTERPFAFLATYSAVEGDSGKLRQYPLSHALNEFQGDNKKLLSLLTAVKRVARESAFINELLESGELFQALGFTISEAHRFLDEVELYENAGILCKVPKWWSRRSSAFKVNLSVGGVSTRIGAEALLDIRVSLTADGEELQEDEVRRILEDTAPLAMLKGRWVAINRESLARVRSQFLKAKKIAEKQGLSLQEALKLILEQRLPGLDGDDSPIEISAGEWLQSVLEKLKDPMRIGERSLPAELKADLRPYQVQGFQWLSFLAELGFGGCLADDMGLGKTVQMIAFFLECKKYGINAPQLVIVPTSLIENWKAELTRFAPTLRVGVLHPSGLSAQEAREKLSGLDVLITTYGMTVRVKWLLEEEFDCIVLDEAQAVKNASTAQARAVKKLKGVRRFIMTGTPVENRLTDLWSLFDFANPGLLGTATEFKECLKKAENTPERYGRLRQAVSPYILRRLKTDRSIIADLPEKTECRVYAELTKKQAVLYAHLVSQLERALETAEGPARRGIVLGYLIKFKQLCNHPDHYSGLKDYEAFESGKFLRLLELCEKIQEEREKVLVFTQFAEIVGPLVDQLERLFGRRGVCLTGQMTVAERKTAVKRFQEDPQVRSFVLSVRAGGLGLNLTAANHVIHFDRWWNPAVENQATDRAFRIGQQKRVLVHKFITRGTVEEKIDHLIEEKLKLAEDVVGGAEAAIMNLSNREIVSLFTYSFK
jgi:SNF2 family DNA or RNA helicase